MIAPILIVITLSGMAVYGRRHHPPEVAIEVPVNYTKQVQKQSAGPTRVSGNNHVNPLLSFSAWRGSYHHYKQQRIDTPIS